mmetsp:Transcript_62989/g.186039  ORF Transcript_62989/g.186039 Transcript_62989/m.186039 type:complete len:209 (+) Transcript_62989:255-881(+)
MLVPTKTFITCYATVYLPVATEAPSSSSSSSSSSYLKFSLPTASLVFTLFSWKRGECPIKSPAVFLPTFLTLRDSQFPAPSFLPAPPPNAARFPSSFLFRLSSAFLLRYSSGLVVIRTLSFILSFSFRLRSESARKLRASSPPALTCSCSCASSTFRASHLPLSCAVASSAFSFSSVASTRFRTACRADNWRLPTMLLIPSPSLSISL